MSMPMSALGTFWVGIGLLSGRRATQIVDFFRRIYEQLAIIMTYAVYRITNRRKANLEWMTF